MTTRAESIGIESAREKIQDHPVGSVAFDWAVVGLSAWFLGGLFIDGWAHNHLAQLETFFTPWHGVFYSGYFAVAAFLVFSMWRNHSKGHLWTRALPKGYEITLLGVPVFFLGGVGDMIWHIVFGIERNLEALLSPTHLMLATGIAMIVSGPLRAAWHRSHSQGWAGLAPMLISLTFLLSLFSFMTQFAHPITQPWPTQKIATLDLDSEIYLMSATGINQTRLTITPGMSDESPALSPDGSKIAFASSRDGNQEIYLMNADGTGLINLTQNKASDFLPAFSPDGTKIAFVSNREGNHEIYVMSVDGTNLTRLTTNAASDWKPTWSPDSKQIAFTSERDGNLEIYVMNADSSNPVNISKNGARDWRPAWSPVNNQIVFASSRDNNIEVYLINADGTGTQNLTENKAEDYQPTWSSDGAKIAFVSNRNQDADIYAMNADGSNVANISNNPGMDDAFPSWAQDKITYSSTGNPILTEDFASADQREWGQMVGILTILLQAALLMGLILLAVRRWSLPFGSITLIFVLNALLMGTQTEGDTLAAIPQVLLLGGLAGLLADLLLWRLKPSTQNLGAYRFFACATPLALYGVYFALLQLSAGVSWTVHLWAGAIFLAGVIGLLVSYLVMTPKDPVQQTSS